MRLPRPLWRNGGTPCWGRRYQPKPTLPPSSSAPFEPSLSLATYSEHLTNSKQGDYPNTVGCEMRERTSRVSPLRTPKVWPLPMDSPDPPKGVWAFHSRPELSPAAVEVTTTQGHQDTAPGYLFVALKEGAGEHGPMIIDDRGQIVWYGKYTSARNFKMQYYQGRPVLTWW